MRVLNWVLSLLFPPVYPVIKVGDLSDTKEYDYRMSRTGVDRVPGMYVGRVTGSAKPRRIIQLGPRSEWE